MMTLEPIDHEIVEALRAASRAKAAKDEAYALDMHVAGWARYHAAKASHQQALAHLNACMSRLDDGHPISIAFDAGFDYCYYENI